MISLGDIAGMLLTLIVYGAYIFLIAFTLWMAVDAGKQDRFWWMVLIIGIPFVGSGVYFFTEKKHEYAKAESHHIHDGETEAQHETSPHKKRSRHKKSENSVKSVEEASPTEQQNTIAESAFENNTEIAIVQEEKKEEGDTV
mgnify:CR=1 FL=1